MREFRRQVITALRIDFKKFDRCFRLLERAGQLEADFAATGNIDLTDMRAPLDTNVRQRMLELFCNGHDIDVVT